MKIIAYCFAPIFFVMSFIGEMAFRIFASAAKLWDMIVEIVTRWQKKTNLDRFIEDDLSKLD